MSKTAIAFIAWLIICYILEWTAPKELDKKCPKVDKSEKPNNQKSLWEHPLLLEMGITKPVEDVELEEVEIVDAPLVWNVFNDKRLGETIISTELTKE